MNDDSTNSMILDALDDHIALLDTDGTIKQVNAAWRRFARENGDSDLCSTGPGTNYLAVCARSAQLGDILAQHVLSGLHAVFAKYRPSFQIEYPCHSPQEQRWFLMHVAPLAPDDRRVLIAHRPITSFKQTEIRGGKTVEALSQAEAKLRLQAAALEAAATPIVITDYHGVIEWVNPAYTRLTGYTAIEAIGLNPRILKSGKHTRAFYAQMWDAILAGKVWRGELTNRRKDGQLYDEEQTITPVQDEAGQVAHFIAIKQDITERKQWEYEQLARTTLSTELGAAVTRTDMLKIMLRRMCDLLTVTGGGIAIASISSDQLTIELADGIWRTHLGRRLGAFSVRIRDALARNRPFFQAAAAGDRSGALLDNLPAIACIPLNINREPFGALLVGREQPFSAAEQHVLIAVAEIAANALHRATLHEQTELHLQRMQSLHRVDKAISAGLNIDTMLGIVLHELKPQLTMDAIAILRMHPTLLTLERVAASGFLTRRWPQTIRLGEGDAGQVALKHEMVYRSYLTAWDVAESGVPQEEGFVLYYGIPLVSKGQLKGVLELFARAPFHATVDWRATLDMFTSQLAIALDNADMVERLQRSHTELMHAYETTIEGWSRALDLRDKETEGHTLRVTEMTMRLARAAGVTDDDLVHIRRGALLHDIGKMGVPDHILLKPGPLTHDEWEIMRKHPTYAYEMLAPIAFLNQALAIPYCHHERYDGKGYPRGLKGEQIPLAARIFAVVDVWDALRSNRPYREGWPESRVRAHIRDSAGTHFDPQVVESFLQMLGGESVTAISDLVDGDCTAATRSLMVPQAPQA